MKLTICLSLLLALQACVVYPVGGGAKAGGGTAVLCHKGKKTMELPSSAAQAHYDHGDSPGPC